jgi:hypothetical protein
LPKANAAVSSSVLLLAIARSQPRPLRLGWSLNAIPRSTSLCAAFERGLAKLGWT